jgi:hypothetical protein
VAITPAIDTASEVRRYARKVLSSAGEKRFRQPPHRLPKTVFAGREGKGLVFKKTYPGGRASWPAAP